MGAQMAMYGGMEQQAQPEAPSVDRVFPPDDTPPSHTLYVSNLNERIREDELRRDLDAIFAQFGKVICYILSYLFADSSNRCNEVSLPTGPGVYHF